MPTKTIALIQDVAGLGVLVGLFAAVAQLCL